MGTAIAILERISCLRLIHSTIAMAATIISYRVWANPLQFWSESAVYRRYNNILPAFRPFSRLQGWTGSALCGHTQHCVDITARHFPSTVWTSQSWHFPTLWGHHSPGTSQALCRHHSPALSQHCMDITAPAFPKHCVDITAPVLHLHCVDITAPALPSTVWT